MAFIARSPKKSLFQQQTNNTMLSSATHEPIDQRIHHHIGGSEFRRLLGEKSQRPRKNRHKNQSQSEVGSEFSIVQGQTEEDKRLVYQFRGLRRPKHSNKGNASLLEQELKKLCHEVEPADLPISSSAKTMVKYVKPNQNKCLKQFNQDISPGPGAYNPRSFDKIRSPILAGMKTVNLMSMLNKPEQTPARVQEENLFAVRYTSMNTSSFKKMPNSLSMSNRSLLGRLFRNADTKEDEEGEQQYCIDEQRHPGPGQYDSQHEGKVGSGVAFPREERFKFAMPQGSGQFYCQQKRVYPQQVKNTSCFVSEVERFAAKSPQPPATLQNQDYTGSHLKQNRNRYEIPFDSTIKREVFQTVQDTRPYYEVKMMGKNDLSGKISKYGDRTQTTKKKQQVPGPGLYNPSNEWHEKSGGYIGKSPKNLIPAEHRKENTNTQASGNFLLTFTSNSTRNQQPSPLKKDKPQPPTPPSLPQPPAEAVPEFPQRRQPADYYNISSQWVKPSFNKHFSPTLLSATNPIKNRLL